MVHLLAIPVQLDMFLLLLALVLAKRVLQELTLNLILLLVLTAPLGTTLLQPPVQFVLSA
jgi:hypothetical protein